MWLIAMILSTSLRLRLLLLLLGLVLLHNVGFQFGDILLDGHPPLCCLSGNLLLL
jgi:hypothetical protein